MIRLLASKRGASSVLVILLLLVLMVFGIAALTTSLSGLRLGQKVTDWSNAYYTAEGVAAHRWAEIDAAVGEAGQRDAAGFEKALADKLAELDFEAQLASTEEGFAVTYEVREGNIGLHVTLALGKDGSVLRPVEWYQIS